MPDSRRLVDYLIGENPQVQIKPRNSSTGNGKRTKSCTTNPKYPTPSKLQRWDEFDFPTLSSLFNEEVHRKLQTTYNDLHDFSYVPKASLEISNEHSLEALLIKSIHSVVLEALEITSDDLLSERVLMAPGGRGALAKVLHADELGPDWAGTSSTQEDNNILPGDTKLSRNWKSDDISKIPMKDGLIMADTGKAAAPIEPLKQILHYCIQSYMRYGYLITDEELVVFRVGLADENKESDSNASADELYWKMRKQRVKMEWQSIPWNNHGQERELTIKISLWVLHLLAANNGALDWKYKPLADEQQRDPMSRMRTKLEMSSETRKKLEAENPRRKTLDNDSKVRQRLGVKPNPQPQHAPEPKPTPTPTPTPAPSSFRSTSAATTTTRASDGDTDRLFSSFRSDLSQVSGVPPKRKPHTEATPSKAPRGRKRQRSTR